MRKYVVRFLKTGGKLLELQSEGGGGSGDFIFHKNFKN